MKNILKSVAFLTFFAIASTSVKASEAAAREVCKQFISKSGYSVKDWGESWNWTTINNGDGTWSVGARFDGAPPGGTVRNLYVTCIAKKNGDTWRLEKLVRLQ